MSMFDSFSREQLRQSYLDAWRKRQAGSFLSPLEVMIVEVIGGHPEYQPVVEDAARALALKPSVGHAEENPFLHMGLHLAVREQIAVDLPPGVRDVHGKLCAQYGDSHRADHVLMEALAQTLHDAQRAGRAPDEARYLQLVRRRLAGRA